MDEAVTRLRDAGYETDSYNAAALKEIIRIGLERSNRLKDLPRVTGLFFVDRVSIRDPESLRIVKEESSRKIYREFLNELAKTLDGESVGTLREVRSDLVASLMQRVGKKLGIRGRTLWEAFRVALTGQLEGPELKEIIAIFDVDKVRKFVEVALTIE